MTDNAYHLPFEAVLILGSVNGIVADTKFHISHGGVVEVYLNINPPVIVYPVNSCNLASSILAALRMLSWTLIGIATHSTLPALLLKLILKIAFVGIRNIDYPHFSDISWLP